MRNVAFEKYVSALKMEDNSTWKPIRNKRNRKTSSQIRKYSTTPGPLAKIDKENDELFEEHLMEDLST